MRSTGPHSPHTTRLRYILLKLQLRHTKKASHSGCLFVCGRWDLVSSSTRSARSKRSTGPHSPHTTRMRYFLLKLQLLQTKKAPFPGCLFVCGRWDLNPHDRNDHKILSLARLPVPTLPRTTCFARNNDINIRILNCQHKLYNF